MLPIFYPPCLRTRLDSNPGLLGEKRKCCVYAAHWQKKLTSKTLKAKLFKWENQLQCLHFYLQKKSFCRNKFFALKCIRTIVAVSVWKEKGMAKWLLAKRFFAQQHFIWDILVWALTFVVQWQAHLLNWTADSIPTPYKSLFVETRYSIKLMQLC